VKGKRGRAIAALKGHFALGALRLRGKVKEVEVQKFRVLGSMVKGEGRPLRLRKENK